MNYLLKLLVFLLGFMIFAYIFTSLATFFNIQMQDYLSYIIFIFALVIIYLILPFKRLNIIIP